MAAAAPVSYLPQRCFGVVDDLNRRQSCKVTPARRKPLFMVAPCNSYETETISNGKRPDIFAQLGAGQFFTSYTSKIPEIITHRSRVEQGTSNSTCTQQKRRIGRGAPSCTFNLFQRAISTVLNVAEDILISSFHHRNRSLPRAVDPSVQISGNFAPVDEQPPWSNLPVRGRIPPQLDGVYARNGANPLHLPTMGHHLFDGDGMVHVVRIHRGSATYACRYTETYRLTQERALQRPVFPKAIGELHGHLGIARLILFYLRCLFGLIDVTKGIGVANAGLVYFRGRLLAMSEDDLPYHVRVTSDGDIQTLGRYNFDGQLSSSMIAHPKLDPVTGELVALSYNVIGKPHIKYFRFGLDGVKSPDVNIPVDVAAMVHDFAITQNLVIVPDQQMVFNLGEMIRDASPVIYDSKKRSRFGVLPRYAKDASALRWIDVPDCFCFHIWNAWEERGGQEVIIICSCMSPPDSMFKDSQDELKIVLSEIRIDLVTGQSSRRPVLAGHPPLNLEAGTFNRNCLGRKTRFIYVAIAEPWPKVSGFAKVDLLMGNMQKFVYGNSRYGGEPCFVPKSISCDEDDGYVVTFMHDEGTSVSELLIVNARHMMLEASLRLPSRVPYGFHGTFVTSGELERHI